LKENLAKENARVFGASSYYADVNCMLENEQLDAAIIVGPPQMHEDVGTECLEHGLHIFVEKPSSISVEGAKKLAETANRIRKFGQVGHMMRHSPPIDLAKRIISSKRFGKPIFIESKYFTSGPREPRTFWGLEDLEWTYMLVQGLHPIDLTHLFMGDIQELSARIYKADNGRIAIIANLQFVEGGIGLLNLSSAFPGWETRLEIVGDAGLFVSVENMSRLRYSENKSWAENFAYGEPNLCKTWEVAPYDQGERVGYQGELSHFIKSVQSNTRPHPDLWDAYKSLMVAKCILKSARINTPIQLIY
jgi:predicted dehydrogenase